MNTIKSFTIFANLISLLFATTLSAELPREEVEYHLLFKEANEAFSAEEPDYELALEKYLTILNSRGYSVNLLGHISNCYFKLSQLGYARLYLEKALLLEPHNPDIINNHRIIMEKLGFETEQPAKLLKSIKAIPTNSYFLFSWIILTIPCLFLLWNNLIQKKTFSQLCKDKRMIWLSILGVSLASLLLYFSYIAADKATSGIVITNNATLKLSPFETAEDQFNVTEGEMLKIINIHDDFYHCYTNEKTGKGWISSKHFIPIAL